MENIWNKLICPVRSCISESGNSANEVQSGFCCDRRNVLNKIKQFSLNMILLPYTFIASDVQILAKLFIKQTHKYDIPMAILADVIAIYNYLFGNSLK